jgi:hypothetical protein
MQFRLGISICVFIGSYLPLAAILFFQDVNYPAFLGHQFCWPLRQSPPICIFPLRHPAESLAALAITTVCLLVTLLSLTAVRAKNRVRIKSARYVPAELISYTIPYIVSFMAIGFDDVAKFAGLVVFMITMFLIVYKSGQLVLNPVLVVFGWRLYDLDYSFVGDSSLYNAKALSKGTLQPNMEYLQASLQDVMIIRSRQYSGGRSWLHWTS